MSGMCNLSAGVWNRGVLYGREEGRLEGKEEGREEGREEGKELSKLDDLKNVIEEFAVTFEKAASSLKIPQSEWEKYRAKLSM
jgi:predicted transposase YdaD